MADQAELAFIKTHLNTLSSLSITYPNDFQQPPQDSLRRVPVLPIDLPPPPERTKEEVSSSGSISVTFKCLKPPRSFTLSLNPADPISEIKNQLSAQSRAPPAEAQSLVIKGKALADGKLLKEYNVKDGDTITLMIKPGAAWDPNAEIATPSPSTVPEIIRRDADGDIEMKSSNATASKPRMGHGRVPSIVLSTSPSPSTPSSPAVLAQDISLLPDMSPIATSAQDSGTISSSSATYRDTISHPAFWERLHVFFRSEFSNREDAAAAFEDFLRASKGTLTVSEIAKIRDHVGIVGMAGT